MPVKKENRFIYAVKFIACLFVITIHAPLPGLFGDIVGAASRFAVPFFFAVAGRFLLTDEKGGVIELVHDIRDRVSYRLINLLKVTGKVYLVYLIYSLFYVFSTGASFSEWFTGRFNKTELINFLLFNSGRFIFDSSYTFDHMWYLFALIYVYGLIYIFAPVLRKWYKWLIVLLTGLLYFGEALQTWYPIRPFDISIKTWFMMRNWLFVGMPFVLMGVLFADHLTSKRAELGEEGYLQWTSKIKLPSIIAIVFGFILSVTERFVIDSKEVYLGSLVIVIGILFLSEAVTSSPKALYVLGKRASSNIYYYHVLVIAILDYLCLKGYILQYNMWQKTILVIVICVLIFGSRPLVDLWKGLSNE